MITNSDRESTEEPVRDMEELGTGLRLEECEANLEARAARKSTKRCALRWRPSTSGQTGQCLRYEREREEDSTNNYEADALKKIRVGERAVVNGCEGGVIQGEMPPSSNTVICLPKSSRRKLKADDSAEEVIDLTMIALETGRRRSCRFLTTKRDKPSSRPAEESQSEPISDGHSSASYNCTDGCTDYVRAWIGYAHARV